MQKDMFVVQAASGKLLDVLHKDELELIHGLNQLTLTPLEDFAEGLKTGVDVMIDPDINREFEIDFPSHDDEVPF